MFARFIAVIGCAFIAQSREVSMAEDPSRVPTPVPELRQLADSVGSWETSQRYRATPDATALESKSTENVRWSEGQQFLISEQRGLTPLGWSSRVLVTSWNPVDRQFHVVEIQEGGFTTEMTLWFEGKVQKVVGYRRFGDSLVRTELTVEHTSPDEYKFRMDCTGSSGVWVCSEGRSKRIK